MTASSVTAVNNLDDLQEALQRTNQAVAMVYVRWCPFCRRAVPLFEKAARASLGIFLLVLDHEEDIASLYDIEVYPTLLKFTGGRVTGRLAAAAGVGLSEQQIQDFLQSGPQEQ